jgi:prepilin-type N-terminal cleavage/methylation domain-containing protein
MNHLANGGVTDFWCILNSMFERGVVKRHTKHPKSRGFSLIEVLVVAAILGVLLAVVASLLGTKNLQAGRDGRRKDDLKRLKLAFEEYYDDNSSFPATNILNTCGGNGLAPYILQIPCDPSTSRPYVYVAHPDGVEKGYAIYTALEKKSDPIIEKLNCQGVNGCGLQAADIPVGDPHDEKDYNYGVSEGMAIKR